MASDHKEHMTFYLTGKRAASLEPLEALDLRPVLFARYRNLTSLRYDFPVVLVREGADSGPVQSLTSIVHRVLDQMPEGDDDGRGPKQMLRLEQEIRALVAEAGGGLLSSLWDTAAARIGAQTGTEGLPRDILDRARTALDVDGEVVDCDATLPARVFMHAWGVVQEKKASQFRADVNTLALKLSDILRADVARSAAGQSPDRLRASVGLLYEDAFDFKAMSRVLMTVAPKSTLTDGRRQRIQSLVAVLESYEFSPDAYVFTNCGAALGTYRARLPKMNALVRAVAIAELEVEGQYREATHDELFAELDAEGVGNSRGPSPFPDYLVCVNAGTMDPSEQATLMEVLSAGIPMKILVQSDDILDESAIGDGHLGFGMRSRQLANMAIGLNEVYVLQSTGSHLVQSRHHVFDGLTYPGPALFSVFSGATGRGGDLPPYLRAAAAVESRAFPIFRYDPSAGTDWASRFGLDGNPQVERDWPIHALDYEGEGHQRITEDVAFTLVDFVASDGRYSKHFSRVGRANWNGKMIPVSESLTTHPGDPKGGPDHVPYVLMADRNQTLQKVLVDEKLVREARRCREMWHSLQELGGIHDSYTERRAARERKAGEHGERGGPEVLSPAAEVAPSGVAAALTAAVPAPEVAEEPGDGPYIETARCTTCNECTQINGKMFAYNENRQAYIADPDAGTFAQLVEAAESCQVSIIHPGKPRNPNEPGLEELLKRAETFR